MRKPSNQLSLFKIMCRRCIQSKSSADWGSSNQRLAWRKCKAQPSALPHRSISLSSSPTLPSPWKCAREALEAPARREETQEREKGSGVWEGKSNSAPIPSSYPIAALPFLSKQSRPSLFLLWLSVFIKLTRSLSLAPSQGHSFFPLLFTGCRLAGL